MIAAIGWVGSALVVLSLTQRDVRRLRQVNLAASAALGIFNIALGIPSMIVLNVVLAAVNLYHLLGHSDRSEAAVELERQNRTNRPAGRSGTADARDIQSVLAVAGRHASSSMLA